jgi:hypothetical protein
MKKDKRHGRRGPKDPVAAELELLLQRGASPKEESPPVCGEMAEVLGQQDGTDSSR